MEPTSCKTPTIYDTGAGVGGDEYIEIEGTIYKVVKINGQEWLNKNLCYINRAWSPSGSSTTEPRATIYRASIDSGIKTAVALSSGVLYNPIAARWIINNIDLKGFRLPTSQEIRDLYTTDNRSKLKTSYCWTNPGTDEFNFNLPAYGIYTGSSFNNYGSNATIWSDGVSNTPAEFNYLNDSGVEVSGDTTNSSYCGIRLIRG